MSDCQKTTKKKQFELLMNRTVQHRELVESKEIFEKTSTIPERLGSDYW
jgi:hypothetical protein